MKEKTLNFKKLIYFVAFVLCLFACIAISVSAEDLDVRNNGTIIAQGTCGAEGDNLTWVLTDCYPSELGRVLTISGTGDMANYDGYNFNTDSYGTPWKEALRINEYSYWSLDTVIVSEGVTSIGDNAEFYGKVSLPSTLKRIGAYAFEQGFITEINLPNNLEYIGIGAFYCSGLSGDLVIPDSVKIIEADAFDTCNITSVKLNDSLTYLGAFAFRN